MMMDSSNNFQQDNIKRTIVYNNKEYKIVFKLSSDHFIFDIHQIQSYIFYENIFSYKFLHEFQLLKNKNNLKEQFNLILDKIENNFFRIEKNDKNMKFIILDENNKIELNLLKKENYSNELIELLLDEVNLIKQNLFEEINKLKSELKIKDNRIENLNARVNLLEKEIFCYDRDTYFEKNKSKIINNTNLKYITENEEEEFEYSFQETQFNINNPNQNNLSCEFIIDKKTPINIKSNYQGKKSPIKVNIKIKNNGIIPLPNGCILKNKSKDDESDFMIMDTLFNGEEIKPNQIFYATIFLFFKNNNDIKEGINILKFILYHEKFGQIGDEGLIQIEVVDEHRE